MRRTFIFGLLCLTGVLLQSTLFARLQLFGVTADVVLVMVICFALLEGPTVGAGVGFASGFLRDLLLSTPKGLTGLSYLTVGYVVGSVRPYVESTSVFVPVAGVFAGSLAATALFEILESLLGLATVPLARTVRVVILVAIYNTLLVPFVYPLVRQISLMDKQTKVYRW